MSGVSADDIYLPLCNSISLFVIVVDSQRQTNSEEIETTYHHPRGQRNHSFLLGIRILRPGVVKE